MRKSICFFAFIMAILCFNLNTTKVVAGDSKTKDNCFPVGRLVSTMTLLDNDTAFSFLVEGGPRSYRFNGTLGFICENQSRFKISAEHLSQRLRYDFESGKTHRWMHQLALGGVYQYRVECPGWIEGLQLRLDYSNAPSKNISNIQLPTGEFNLRRIAGSWSWMGEAGVIIKPWECATLITSLGYDQVRYKRKYQHGKRVSGVGFSLDFTQRFWSNFLLDIDYEFTQAYNNIGAALRWDTRFECGDLGIGVFANHVFGKRRLPCSTTAGAELTFAFGLSGCNIVPIGPYSFDECDYNACSYDVCDLVAWVSDPAVYRPQVLAIADQALCTAPTLSTTITPFPSIFVAFDTTSTYPTALYFATNSSILTYTASGLPAGSSIDPTTGVITLVNTLVCDSPAVVGTVFVTAQDECGSQTSSFTYTLGTSSCPT
jgi:hypothetical protein